MKRAAIIGCGMIANSAHIPAYRHLPDDFEIVGVCDININTARDTANRHGISYFTDNAQKMLCELKPEIVSVCVPNMFHAEYTKLALNHGANVLCEKPLSVSFREAKELFDLAKEKKLALCACQSMRYTPDRLYVHSILSQGLAGEIYYGEFSRIRHRGIPKWGGFHIQRISGGGAFIDIGVHMLDALVWLMGNKKVKSVSGTMGAYIAKTANDTSKISRESGVLAGEIHSERKYSDVEFDVEDFASGSIRFEGGASVNFKVAWAANLPDETSIVLCGKDCGIKLPELSVFGGEKYAGNGQKLECPIKNPYPDEPFCGHFMLMDDLAKFFRGEGELPVKPGETLNVSAIIDLFYKSAKKGIEVSTDEL